MNLIVKTGIKPFLLILIALVICCFPAFAARKSANQNEVLGGNLYSDTWWRPGTFGVNTSEKMYYLSDSDGKRVDESDEVYIVETRFLMLPLSVGEDEGNRRADPKSYSYRIRGFFSGKYIPVKNAKIIWRRSKYSSSVLEVQQPNGRKIYFSSANAIPSGEYPKIYSTPVSVYLKPIKEIDWVKPELIAGNKGFPCEPTHDLLSIQLSEFSVPKNYLVAALGPIAHPRQRDSENVAYRGRCGGANQFAIMAPSSATKPLKDGTVILAMSSYSGHRGFLRIRPENGRPDAYLPNIISMDYSDYARYSLVVDRRIQADKDACLGEDSRYCKEMEASLRNEGYPEFQQIFRLIQLFLFPQSEIQTKTSPNFKK